MKLHLIAAATLIGFTAIIPVFADSITTTSVEPFGGSTTSSTTTTTEVAPVITPAPVVVPESTTNNTVVVDKRKKRHLLHIGIPFVNGNIL